MIKLDRKMIKQIKSTKKGKKDRKIQKDHRISPSLNLNLKILMKEKGMREKENFGRSC